MTTLVTGATGFIGQALVRRFVEDGRPVRAAARIAGGPISGVARSVVGELSASTDWSVALRGVSCVVHLAGRAHVMRESALAARERFERANVDGTVRLAKQAADAGVRRFVFISSIKVHGDSGTVVETDRLAPSDPYGLSKLRAEEGLQHVAQATQLEATVIRPPLVYGPGVGANFGSLLRAVARGIPLPFGAVHNSRSLVGRGNLIDFIARCSEHPAAANETFLVSDDEDLSTAELIRRMAGALHRPPRLVSIPSAVLTIAAALMRRRDLAIRLLGSLRADITKAKHVLDWRPPVSIDQELRATVAAFAARVD